MGPSRLVQYRFTHNQNCLKSFKQNELQTPLPPPKKKTKKTKRTNKQTNGSFGVTITTLPCSVHIAIGIRNPQMYKQTYCPTVVQDGSGRRRWGFLSPPLVFVMSL